MARIADTLRKEIEVIGQSRIEYGNAGLAKISTNCRNKNTYITSFDSVIGRSRLLNYNKRCHQWNFHRSIANPGQYCWRDTTMAIKTIKPPLKQTYTWMDWLKDNMYVVYSGLAHTHNYYSNIYYVATIGKVLPQWYLWKHQKSLPISLLMKN